jgi:menaquinone-dependent protoporphyrinogen oxidase
MNTITHRPQVLVSAASEHGSTSEIARLIGCTLANNGIAVDIVEPAAVDTLEDYDAVILGSAVYAGHWMASARDLAFRFREPLATRAVWLFSSGPSGELVRPTGQDPADVIRIGQAIAVRGHRMFAGKLDTQVLSLAQRASLLVSHRTGGDFRDWVAIAEWAEGIAADPLSASPLPAA